MHCPRRLTLVGSAAAQLGCGGLLVWALVRHESGRKAPIIPFDLLRIRMLALSLVTAPGDPGELRDVLRGLRDTDLGEQQVDAVRLGLVPLSRRCVLAPWVVAGSVRLLRPRR